MGSLSDSTDMLIQAANVLNQDLTILIQRPKILIQALKNLIQAVNSLNQGLNTPIQEAVRLSEIPFIDQMDRDFTSISRRISGALKRFEPDHFGASATGATKPEVTGPSQDAPAA